MFVSGLWNRRLLCRRDHVRGRCAELPNADIGSKGAGRSASALPAALSSGVRPEGRPAAAQQACWLHCTWLGCVRHGAVQTVSVS